MCLSEVVGCINSTHRVWSTMHLKLTINNNLEKNFLPSSGHEKIDSEIKMLSKKADFPSEVYF